MMSSSVTYKIPTFILLLLTFEEFLNSMVIVRFSEFLAQHRKGTCQNCQS